MKREELIDKYIQGAVTSSEKEDFDHFFTTDVDFKNDVKVIKNLSIVLGAQDRKDLKKVLLNFETKIAAHKTKAIPLFKKKKFFIITSIILLIIIGCYLILSPSANPDVLYVDNFEIYPNITTPIIRGENDRNKEVMAFMAYEEKHYTIASNQFAALYNDTQKSYFLLYQANCLLAINQIETAIPLLEQQIALNDAFKEKSMWYLALAYLKNKNKIKAIAILEKITTDNSFKKEEATVLIKKLN